MFKIYTLSQGEATHIKFVLMNVAQRYRIEIERTRCPDRAELLNETVRDCDFALREIESGLELRRFQ